MSPCYGYPQSMRTSTSPARRTLPQERRLVTEIPGPQSEALQARRTAAVAAGVGTTLPIYVEAAGGGVIVDVDGNSLIDLGSGIAVTDVGNAAPAVVAAVAGAGRARSPTPASWSRRTRATSRSARRSTGSPPATTPRSARRCSTPAPRRSRTPSRSPARYTGRDAVVVFDHAYHGRTNLTMALTAKNMPYKQRLRSVRREVYRVADVVPVPRRPRSGREAGGRARSCRIEKQVGADNVAAIVDRADPGRGRLHRPGRRASCPRSSSWCTDNGIVFVADEIQTGFCRTGDWFACEHEGVVPDLITTAKGIAGGLPLAGVTGRAEIMDAVARRRPRRHLRRQPGRLRRRARRDRHDRELDLIAAARRIERGHDGRGCRRLADRVPASSATSAAAAR